MAIRAVILDLDGVIVSTDEQHYRAWKRLADDEGIPFDRETNHRLRGVARMDCVEIILEKAPRRYTDAQKRDLADRKNGYYRDMLAGLSAEAILPGAMAVMDELKRRGVKAAVASSSRNTPYILERVGLADYFDAKADGNDITRSKPHPEVFLIAARRLGVPPAECLVVEDAKAGVEAAVRGGMKALGVGDAADDDRAHLTAPDLASVTVDEMLAA
jgi:beta-phosphoglucomutase